MIYSLIWWAFINSCIIFMQRQVSSNRSLSSYKDLKLPKIDSRRSSLSKNSLIQQEKRQTKLIINKKLSMDSRIPNKTAQHQNGYPEETQTVTAKAYGIFDENLSHILSSNATEKMAIASLTKIITMIAAIRLCQKYKVNKSETFFRISTNAANIQGTISEIEPKQWITVQDLLYALMLPSGNDAAIVLAENLGAYIYYDKKGEKSTLLTIKTLDITRDKFQMKFYMEEFIKFLNQITQQYGIKDTVFANPHGLDDQNHYSTVKDLSILLCKAYENKQSRQIMGCKNYTGKLRMIPDNTASYREIEWINSHRLLDADKYLCGKTGQTIGAGNCLSSVAAVENKIYYIIVLGSNTREDRFKDTNKLLKKLIKR